MTASTDVSAAAHRRTHKRAPDFFIVGQFKCGTTALYEMLRQHPQIYMPDLRSCGSTRRSFAPTGRAPRSRVLRRSRVIWHCLTPRVQISVPARRRPHTSPLKAAARSIADLQPDARIIAILREPASFLRSFHLQCLQNHTETEKDLRKALALEGDRREGKAIPRYAARPLELLYSDHVRYVELLRRYHAVFPPEQVLVLIYEDFRRDNEATVRRVLRFLDVDDHIQLRRSRRTLRLAYDHHSFTNSCARRIWGMAERCVP